MVVVRECLTMPSDPPAEEPRPEGNRMFTSTWDKPMPLVLPQSYSTGSVIRIPTQLTTVGDDIRKRRLELKMLQREVAEQISVNTTSVRNWDPPRRASEC
jgi:hypothetical protein